MTTLRERFVEALIAALQASDDLQAQGVKVERSIYEAVGSGEPRVLVVHRGRDSPFDYSLGATARQCVVMLTAVVHDPAPDRAADDMFDLAHPIVMRFVADGLSGITEGPTDEPRATDADGGAGVITMQYLFQYQTRPDSLS